VIYYFDKLITIRERIFANARYAVADYNARERAAFIERTLANACYAVENYRTRKRAAIIERIIANARYTIGNGDTCKACATGEHRIANARYTIGNCNACKTTAISERILANLLATCDHNGFQRSRNTGRILLVFCCPEYMAKELAICFGWGFASSHKGERNALKTCTAFECIASDMHKSVGESYALNVGALIERFVVYVSSAGDDYCR
jgi:hypothetical protein